MFKELAPLLRNCAVLLTVNHISEDQYRVNIVPKKLSDGDSGALTTPVSVSGTVEDLDIQLPQTLLAFVSSHLELKNTLDRAKAEMDAAAKAAQAQARSKNKNQAGKKDEGGAISGKTAKQIETPAPQKSELPKTESLFNFPDEAKRPAAENASSAFASIRTGTNLLRDEDEEILAEINALNGEDPTDDDTV